MTLSDLFICIEESCGVHVFRSRTSAKIDFGPPTCACGRAMSSAGQVLV